ALKADLHASSAHVAEVPKAGVGQRGRKSMQFVQMKTKLLFGQKQLIAVAIMSLFMFLSRLVVTSQDASVCQHGFSRHDLVKRTIGHGADGVEQCSPNDAKLCRHQEFAPGAALYAASRTQHVPDREL